MNQIQQKKDLLRQEWIELSPAWSKEAREGRNPTRNGLLNQPMLEACGLSVAMGNAPPEVKSIADFVVPSVENDGLAVAINDHVLPKL